MITDTREKFRPYTKPVDFARIIERESVSEMWESCVKEFADLVAIQDNETSHTYSELEDDAAKFRTLPTRGMRCASAPCVGGHTRFARRIFAEKRGFRQK